MAAAGLPALAATAGSGAPTLTGPLTAASDSSGCEPRNGCAFDYLLDRKATSDSSIFWHALWANTPPTGKAAAGFCTIDAIALLSWGAPGRSAPLPTRTFPPIGESMVAPGTAGSLLVDAGGHASRPGRLSEQIGWPTGLVTTVAHHGWMTALWQGRTTGGLPLTLAAEVAAASPTLESIPNGAPNDYSLGVSCADVAPPGTTFLARLDPANARRSQPSWLELRIPATGLIWKTPSEQPRSTAKQLSQSPTSQTRQPTRSRKPNSSPTGSASSSRTPPQAATWSTSPSTAPQGAAPTSSR